MSASALAEHMRPGDRIVVGQAAGEPVGLIAALLELAPRFKQLRVFCGYSLNPAWKGEVPGELRVSTYCGLGSMGSLVARSRAQVIPFSMSQLSSALLSRKMSVDVVLLQVSPADEDGYHSLGPAADYVWEAARMARVVIVEVNASVPLTRSTCRLHQSEVVVGLESDTPLPELPPEPIGEVQLRVAERLRSWCRVARPCSLESGGWPMRWRTHSKIARACGFDPAWSATGFPNWSPQGRSASGPRMRALLRWRLAATAYTAACRGTACWASRCPQSLWCRSRDHRSWR